MQVQANPGGTHQPDRLIRLPEVEAMTGLRKSSIYERSRRNPPAFPKAIKLSRRMVCWSSAAISAWIEERIKAAAK